MRLVLLVLCVGSLLLYCTAESHDECLKFLVNNMPESDIHNDRVNASFLADTVHYALLARNSTSWARDVPSSIFLNDVLPYAVLNEARDPWRPMFHQLFSPLVANATSITEAVQRLNKEIWNFWNIIFVPNQTPFTLSPFETIQHHNASCTGLSIFLVAACRSVGIPARVAGTPHWNRGPEACPHGDADEACGNHDWTEIWDGQWYFTGSHEYTTDGLNHGWFYPEPAQFQLPNSGNHSIYATSWNKTDVQFPMIWAWGDRSVPAVDVTERYTA